MSNLNIPNPFKALKPHIAEPSSLAGEATKETRRVTCDDMNDLGELLTGEMILGFHARGARRKTFCVVWSNKHIQVFEYQSGSLHMLFLDSKISILDVQWTTDSSYTVLFDVRPESRYTVYPSNKHRIALNVIH